MTTRRTFLGSSIGLLLWVGCGDDDGGLDSGRADSGDLDAGRSDAGRSDAGGSDARRSDSGAADAGRSDGGGDGGGDVGGDVGATCEATMSQIGNNHRGALHSLTVPVEDVLAGAARSYDITGSGDHAHMVTLTEADFATLLETGSVSVRSTSFERHDHEVTVTC